MNKTKKNQGCIQEKGEREGRAQERKLRRNEEWVFTGEILNLQPILSRIG